MQAAVLRGAASGQLRCAAAGRPGSSRPLLASPLHAPTWRRVGKGPVPLARRAALPDSTADAAAAPAFKNPLQRELELQSNRLDADVRERVADAVAALRYRATAGDVAARAGVSVAQANEALSALAYDCLAALEVSSAGEVVYSFPSDFKSTLAKKSWLVRARGWGRKAAGVGAYLVRVAFGTALLTSIALVWTAVTVLLSSNRDNDRDDRRRVSSGHSLRLMFDLTDLFTYWDPYYWRNAQQRREAGEEMSFVEALFSFVFGDADPNAKFEELRWRALGQRLQSLGGVASAEEMAPFLDPPPAARGGAPYDEEAFVLPALLRFGGEPIVDEATGTLLYRFPSLQATARESARGWRRGAARSGAAPPPPAPLQEESWRLTLASGGQAFGAAALGAFNLVGVLVLSAYAADPASRMYLAREGLGFIFGLLPGLQLYAASFFAIPAVRAVLNAKRNSEIEERNDRRAEAAALLAAPPAEVRRKQAAARQQGEQTFIGRGDVIFDTAQETGSQANRVELDDWDRKLGVDKDVPVDRGLGGGW